MRTSPFDYFVVDGIAILSRYNEADEFERTARVISSLPPEMRKQIESVFCDSKCTHSYTVAMRPGSDQLEITKPIAERLHALLKQQDGGDNGIKVGSHVEVDPEWAGCHHET